MSKNKFYKNKWFLSVFVSGTLLTATVLPITFVQTTPNNDAVVFKVDKNEIKTRVLNNSFASQIDQQYIYQGIVFNSENDLNKYIYDSNQIETKLTSSNPSKIIKDYEHQILDGKQIHDNNIENFVQIFRDATGQIAYSANAAADTFINYSKIQQKYSYDGIDWFSNAEEAWKGIQNYNKIQKSIYYFVNGKYYNAFNTLDINALINQMEEGYYASLSNKPSGELWLENETSVYGVKNNFIRLMKSKLRDDFFNKYIFDITKGIPENKFSLTPNAEKSITIEYLGQKTVYDNNRNAKEMQPIKLAENYTSSADFLSDFRDETKWLQKKVIRNSYTTKEDSLERKFTIIVNNRPVIATITLTNEKTKSVYIQTGAHPIMTTETTGVPNITKDFKIIDHTVGNLVLFTDQSKRTILAETGTIMNDVYNNSLITNDTKELFFNKWFDEYYLDSVLLNFQGNKNERVDWDNYKNKKYIKNKENNLKISDVYKDKFYDINGSKGHTYSLIQSQKEWEPVKKDIINNNYIELNESGEKLYQFRKGEDLTFTLSELNNFLALFGSVDTREMYSVSSTKNNSDREGRMLFWTKKEAEERRKISVQDTLMTRFSIYDKYNKEIIVSADTKEEAIEELKKEIKLNSKFIHKDEVVSWNSEFAHAWEDVISGEQVNLVYAIRNPNSQSEKIWFASKAKALAAIKTNLKVENNLQIETSNIYAYDYVMDNGLVTTIAYKFEEIEEVVDKIYNFEIQKRKEI